MPSLKRQNCTRTLQKLIEDNLLNNKDKEIAKVLYGYLQKP